MDAQAFHNARTPSNVFSRASFRISHKVFPYFSRGFSVLLASLFPFRKFSDRATSVGIAAA